MSGLTPSPEDARAARQRAIQAAIRFDRAWQDGKAPRIEDELAATPEGDRAVWLEHLLAVEFSIRDQAGHRYDLAEYLKRFPDDTELVVQVFSNRSIVPGPRAGFVRSSTAPPKAQERPAPPPPAPPKAQSGASKEESRELLLGILALQNGFIDHRAFMKAIRVWSRDRSQRVGAILIEAGSLNLDRLKLLDALVEQHRQIHGDDVNNSLSVVDASGTITQSVRDALGDDDDRTISVGPRSPGAGADTNDGEKTGPFPADSPADDDWSYWTRHERYRERIPHGKGSLGQVFRARDGELRREVALKEMQEHIARFPVYRSQFLLEGLITGGLEHPGIAPVYGLGLKDDGSPFYVMKFVRGPDLMEKLRQLHGFSKEPAEESAPTLPQLLRHFISACQAMAYAHSRGILHRDLKPEHVMLGAYGETMVVDWGLATTFQRGSQLSGPSEEAISLPADIVSYLSSTRGRVGTLHYSSPEQALGHNDQLDQRSDIFGLGTTLYTLLTGQTPQKGHDVATALDRIVRGEFPRPRSLKPWIPPSLEAICLKAMALRPDDRYLTATALARDIERYLDDEPVQAYPDTLPMRATRWLRKHRTLTAGGATLLFSSTIFLAGLAYQTQKANAEIRGEQQKTLAAKTAAEEYLQSALTVIQVALLRLASTELPKVPGMEALRKDIATQVTKLLEQLLSQNSDDPRILDTAAKAYRELGNIRRLLGDPKAGEAHQKSIDLYLKLGLHDPTPYSKNRLTQTLVDYAELLRRQGQLEQANSVYTQCQELADELLKAVPVLPTYRRTAARVHYNHAALLHEIGEIEKSLFHCEKALPLLSPLANAKNANSTDSLIYLIFRINHGIALRDKGLHANAFAIFQDVIKRGEKLAVNASVGSDALFATCIARFESGRIGETDPSTDNVRIVELTSALDGMNQLINTHPNLVHYHEYRVGILIARTLRFSRLGKPKGAEQDLGSVQDSLQKLTESNISPARIALLKGMYSIRQASQACDQAMFATARAHLDEAAYHLDIAAQAIPQNLDLLASRRQHEQLLSKFKGDLTPKPH